MAGQVREQWGTRAGFLLAAMGSAIGLGNIWRFPYAAYEGGGGAFIVPYLIALLTAGLPLLILCYSIGHRYHGSPPVALRRLSRPAEGIGWWQVAICFVIGTYYAVIIAWALQYASFSLIPRNTAQWRENPETFFAEDYLRAAEPGMVQSYAADIGLTLLLVWVVTLIILLSGIRRGIERANRIFIPLLIVLFGALVIRAVTLEGAGAGLSALFEPDWSAMAEGQVWLIAYGQVFFSMSIGFGIMITYASYLRRKADLTGNAFVVGLANSSFELLAGIGIFATLGFMALQVDAPVQGVVEQGVGLAFIAFPQVIATMPLGGLFGVLFFLSLAVAGITSLISIMQVVVAALQDRFGLRRLTATLIGGGVPAVISLAVYPTDQGLTLLDVADRFINQYGIVAAALVQVVVVAWALRRLPDLQGHIEEYSSIRLTLWWKICLGVITPIVLTLLIATNLWTEFSEPYEGYPVVLLVFGGGGVAVGAIAVAVLLTAILWKRDVGPVPDVRK
ncbi:sodium-dependent transporter [Spiractinospora alimapuensis]|uniref:sodium-dependent transporter n=1 Tax=Spiractinospora alimapuensis TaxID=2820884 RepID=UPI001F21166C|nr:sodium-dependent transporter [Spiractinospora alimapuensis]QVQ51110.1 sodium-dependent transporter [Spiractinospora alimapuensis]